MVYIKRILVIDDEINFCLMIKEALEAKVGYYVMTAMDGKKGIKLAKREKPDLILLDILMPDMNGLQVLESLKKDKHTMHIPVIMLTAIEGDTFKNKTAELYSEGYLAKSAEMPALRAEIDTVLGRRRQ